MCGWMGSWMIGCLVLDIGVIWCRADNAIGRCSTMALAEGVTAGNEGDSLFVVHCLEIIPVHCREMMTVHCLEIMPTDCLEMMPARCLEIMPVGSRSTSPSCNSNKRNSPRRQLVSESSIMLPLCMDLPCMQKTMCGVLLHVRCFIECSGQ